MVIRSRLPLDGVGPRLVVVVQLRPLLELCPPEPVELVRGVVQVVTVLAELDTFLTLGQLLQALDAAALARGTPEPQLFMGLSSESQLVAVPLSWHLALALTTWTEDSGRGGVAGGIYARR